MVVLKHDGIDQNPMHFVVNAFADFIWLDAEIGKLALLNAIVFHFLTPMVDGFIGNIKFRQKKTDKDEKYFRL